MARCRTPTNQMPFGSRAVQQTAGLLLGTRDITPLSRKRNSNPQPMRQEQATTTRDGPSHAVAVAACTFWCTSRVLWASSTSSTTSASRTALSEAIPTPAIATPRQAPASATSSTSSVSRAPSSPGVLRLYARSLVSSADQMRATLKKLLGRPLPAEFPEDCCRKLASGRSCASASRSSSRSVQVLYPPIKIADSPHKVRSLFPNRTDGC